MVLPDLPFEEYKICTFPQRETGEVIYIVLSLAYGTFFLLSTVRAPTSNSFLVKDALALLIIVYSAKRHAHAGGVPRLFNKIFRDATTYFLVLSTGHILIVFCDFFTPVSEALSIRLPPLTTSYT